jgi:hypothetical protein
MAELVSKNPEITDSRTRRTSPDEFVHFIAITYGWIPSC